MNNSNKGGGEPVSSHDRNRPAVLIVRDVCELDGLDDGPQTVRVHVDDLLRIVDRHTEGLYTHPPVAAEAEPVEPAYQTCNGRSCGWCKEGKEPCLFTDAQRKKRDELIGAPPASGAVPVPRELLERISSLLGADDIRGPSVDELRALLAKGCNRDA